MPSAGWLLQDRLYKCKGQHCGVNGGFFLAGVGGWHNDFMSRVPFAHLSREKYQPTGEEVEALQGCGAPETQSLV